jgi:SMI1 / KNR4 family (SUKH-1)
MTMIANIREQIISSGLATDEQVVGCSESEIKSLEMKLAFRLPDAYREFLAVMGKRAGGFCRGSDMLYHAFWEAQNAMASYLEESDKPLSLPEKAIVIQSHQGYQFFILSASEGANPPVRVFGDGVDGLQQFSTTFTEWLQLMLDQQLATIQWRKDYRKQHGLPPL